MLSNGRWTAKCVSTTVIWGLAGIIIVLLCAIGQSRADKEVKDSMDQVVLIVCGGGIRPDGSLPIQVVERLKKAIELYRAKGACKIVVSGAYSKRVGPGSKTEAQAMKDHLVREAGIPSEDILVEQQSFDTIGNAVYSKAILVAHGYSSAIIITSDYHSKRAKQVFKWVLGPSFAVEVEATDSFMAPKDRELREQSEDLWIKYMDKYLLGEIPAGDDEQIGVYLRTEHPRYALGRRGDAYVETVRATASLEGYEEKKSEGVKAHAPNTNK